MEITKGRLRQIIKEEIDNIALEGRIEGSPEGPWDSDYEQYDELAKKAMEIASSSGDSRSMFDDWLASLQDEEVAGVYQRLHAVGGMDPMTGVSREDPEYVSWRERPNRNPLMIKIAIYIRAKMTPEQHTVRRGMAEPPHPRVTKSDEFYANYEEYYQAEASPEFKQTTSEFGNDDSGILQKYVYSKNKRKM
jgi:hypothetical protein